MDDNKKKELKIYTDTIYPLGDFIGFVQILDYFGSDLTVVNAARVSMNKTSDQINDKDVSLIHYLAKHEHYSPFFMPQLRFRLKMPIFVARQWFTHKIGFSRNEMSRRYVTDPPEFYVPKEYRKKDENIKQGSSDEILDNSREIHNKIYEKLQDIKKLYDHLLVDDVCPEQARIVLPLATYTEFIETGSLYAYFRMYRERSEKTAQWEIRQFADIVGGMVEKCYPESWKALKQYGMKK